MVENNFGWALGLLKENKNVFRKGWNGIINGDTQYLALQIPDENSKMNTPYIYITTGRQGSPHSLVPWIASQTDVLATDWEEV